MEKKITININIDQEGNIEFDAERPANSDKIVSEPYEVPAHKPDPNKCDPSGGVANVNTICSKCKQQYFEFDAHKDRNPKVCGECIAIDELNEKFKKEILAGEMQRFGKKKPGPKPKTKPTTITIVEPKYKDKLYTYNCNKCKKDFETAIEFTSDKRYIRALRCPDCAFRNIFETANRKPKIRGKK